MSLDFGKLDYSVSLNRTSAFPLDAKSYFESKDAALAAAQTAEIAGSKNTSYYFGQLVAVVENNEAEIYVIVPVTGGGGTLKKLGEGGSSLDKFYVGYYLNNEFYKDTTYTEALPHDNKAFYLDINGTNRFYKYHGDGVGFKKQDVQDIDLPQATSEVAGIMKLYGEHGEYTDGTMTQKAISESVEEVKFAIDEGDAECLVLNKPW